MQKSNYFKNTNKKTKKQVHYTPLKIIYAIKYRYKTKERKMKIKPLFDRVVVKPIKEKPEKIGNIILPESAKHPEISEVVALGVGEVDGKKINFEVKIGDKVIFNKYSGNDFKIDNEMYTIIKEKDILAIIEQ